jgi:4'-phosphopantetheinyl transferase
MSFPPGCTWLLQSVADVPADDDWLAAVERARLVRLHVAKRRVDWRLGRWTAKRAVAAALGADGARIAIIATESGAPLALLDGVPAPVAISLSHCAGRGLCVVAPSGAAVGCDLERVEPRSPAFLRDYFSATEQALIGADARRATIVWSVKEAVLKALGEGLRQDTRAVEVAIGEPDSDGWTRGTAAFTHRRFTAWWRDLHDLIAVIATECGG